MTSASSIASRAWFCVRAEISRAVSSVELRFVLKASGVDNREWHTDPVGITIQAIAGRSWKVFDDSATLADEAVENGRLPSIGTANDGDDRFQGSQFFHGLVGSSPTESVSIRVNQEMSRCVSPPGWTLSDHAMTRRRLSDSESPSRWSQETTMPDGRQLAYQLRPENQDAEATSTKRSMAALLVISVALSSNLPESVESIVSRSSPPIMPAS